MKGGKWAGTPKNSIDIFISVKESVDALIERIDALGKKVETMPNVAEKMADAYVGAFGRTVNAIKGAADSIDQIDDLADALRKVADSAKGFSISKPNVESFNRLNTVLTNLSPVIASFPKDVSSLASFATSVSAISGSFAKLTVPTDAQLRRLTKAATALSALGGSLKSISAGGAIPPNVITLLTALAGSVGGGPSTPPPLPPTPPPAPPAPPAPPPTPPPSLRDRAMGYVKNAGAAAAGAAIGGALTAMNKTSSSLESLGQVMPLTNELFDEKGSFVNRNDSDYTGQLKQSRGRISAGTGASSATTLSVAELLARYTANSNRGGADFRDMNRADRDRKWYGTTSNAMELNRKTGLGVTEGADLQLGLERNLGISAKDFEPLKNAFTALARSGALTAQDLLVVSNNAKETGASFQLSGEAAKEYVTNALVSATALSNAGIKQSEVSGMNAGFFGDQKALIADLAAGITDDDYKNHPEEVIRKQMAWANQATAGMDNGMFGNYTAKLTADAGIINPRYGNIESFRNQQFQETERQKQVSALKGNISDPSLVSTSFSSTGRDLSMFSSALGGAVTSVINFRNAFDGYVTGKGASRPTGEHQLEVNARERGLPVDKKASGGIVSPGMSGTSDSVPAMLTPGEEILTKGDPRHRYNIDAFKQSFAQIEGYYAKGDRPNRPQRNLNPGNLRVDADWKNNPEKAMRIAKIQGGNGYDADGYLKFPSEAAGFAGLERQMKIDAKRGMDVGSFIEKYAPATENNTEAYKAFVARKGFGGSVPLADIVGSKYTGAMLADKSARSPALAEEGFTTNPLAALTSTISSMFTGLTGLFASQKPQPPAPVQLDPAVMASLTNIANSNSGSSDVMAEAIGLFAKVVQNMGENSRSRSGINSSSDLVASVARGNYAYTRGA